ncbi:hypothetical protein BRY73_02995 [Ochrobactrum sp. P6BS-III]|uniref:Arc family DNA-binding protein n=1 Tax=unclassified Ochrobactrum TaxID=239106 RepID=UPI00099314A8|nr:hypothetical protein [Ochrobactrum sp. P6BSIII]OOL20144.1 hypothetical protein BRY73_02995 [Ochrobactrum sp. P6BS-III]
MSKVRDQDKFMVRLPDGMREKISADAKAKGRSMNAEIVARIANSAPEKTLRDEFAMAALPSFLTEIYANSRGKNVRYDSVYVIAASASYEMSDAFLAARGGDRD